MKNLIFTCLLFVFIANISKAQFVEITDSNFRKALKFKYPTCFNESGMMDTTCSEIVNEDSLNVSHIPITTLEGIQYFKNLILLVCFNNQLKSLPALPSKLRSLVCENNELTSLPNLPSSLENLYCNDNQLTSLPSLPSNLINLLCSYNLLNNLPSLPSTLRNLLCDNNELNGLQDLPNSIENLYCSVNNISSLSSLPSSLINLDCSNNNLSNLPSLPSSLGRLTCSFNPLYCLPLLPNSLNHLYLARTNIKCLPNRPSGIQVDTILPICTDPSDICQYPYVEIPDSNFRNALKELFPGSFNSSNFLDTSKSIIINRKYLIIYDKNISNLDGLQYFKNLISLDCSFNNLSSLPPLPLKLTELKCQFNKLTFLPELPSTLTRLECNNNNISNLDKLPEPLKVLYCGFNPIKTLQVLPLELTNLACQENQLTILPILPNQLIELNCKKNNISNLPSLPNSLSNLNCSYNQLTYLPELPIGLQFLHVENNNLANLPVLPYGLKGLSCNSNRITSLPPLPTFLYTLDCWDNQLTSLPYLNSMLIELNATYNPLICLPLIPNNLSSLHIKNTNIDCLPNIHIGLTVDTLVPICNNPDKICQTYTFARGIIFDDLNKNSIYDTLYDTLLMNQIVTTLPNEWEGNSNLNGTYLVKLDYGIINTWSCTPTNKYATISPNSYSATPTGLGLLPNDYNFGIHFTPNVKDLEATLAGTAVRPGFTTNIGVAANNIGTVNQSNITVKLKKPFGYDTIATSIPPTSILNDTLFWKNVSIDFLKSQSFYVELQVPVNEVLGAEIIYEAWVNGTQGDTTPTDNYTKWIDTVSGSFDPNDKLVSKTTLPPAYDVEKDRLIYTIRFQNTGTDTAFYVRVKDEIPSNLNLSTLRVINASHTYQLIVREKNIVEFAFPNILLPDKTTNEPKSHGFVQFSIQPKVGLPVNTKIENNAAIYFDYNAPIITNFATTEVKLTTGLASNKNLDFKLYPNPTNGTVRIELPYSGDGNWILSDISGRQLKADNIANNEKLMELNLNDLPSGTYFITIQLGGNVSTAKIIKM